MTGLSLPLSELPDPLHRAHPDRVHTREEGLKEFRFYLRARPALLPVWWCGRLHVLPWGNKCRADRRLPPTAWTWRESVEAGKWAQVAPEPVDIPARCGFTNGVWFKVTQGFRGLLVKPPAGDPVVFLICEPATRYYRVMTRSEWMPVLIGEII